MTTYDAYLLLEGLNGGAVTLPAGGKTDVTVTMTLTEAQKKALDEHYVNGAYVEGLRICRSHRHQGRGSGRDPLHPGVGLLRKLDGRFYVRKRL